MRSTGGAGQFEAFRGRRVRALGVIVTVAFVAREGQT